MVPVPRFVRAGEVCWSAAWTAGAVSLWSALVLKNTASKKRLLPAMAKAPKSLVERFICHPHVPILLEQRKKPSYPSKGQSGVESRGTGPPLLGQLRGLL